MERLTKVINACGKTIIVYTQGKYEDTTAGEMEHEDIRNVMKRLSDYEDTGLTPEQIAELKERNTAKVPDYEGDGCDKDGNIIYDTWICPNCGEKYEVDYDDYEHCPKCGQAIEQGGGMEMSDDLISRKALLKELREIMDEPHNTMFLTGIGAAVSIVEHRETAFDKEKVIEELKSNMGSAQLAQLLAGTDLVQCGGFSYGYYNGMKDAIEIFEKGGIE